MDAIELLYCDSVQDFLAALSPIGERYCDQTCIDPPEFGFRGHANANWLLHGRSVREALCERQRLTNRQIISRELGLLKDFFWASDEVGAALPEDSQELRRLFKDLRFQVEHERNLAWPTPKIWSLASLGQHYGVATRLLDWSFSPYIAAYFAASTAARWVREGLPDTEKDATHLCVLALAIEQFDDKEGFSSEDDPIAIIRSPRASNPNLRAQWGFHTVVQSQEPLDGVLCPKPLNAVVDSADLTGVALPLALAPSLLFAISKFGVSAATINPTLFGVAEALRERHLWEPVRPQELELVLP